MAEARLSVIIPYYRAAATLGGTLESLSRQRWSEPWEVIISDNEGSDELREIAQRFMSRLNLRVVDSSDRRGPAHACNVGAEAARGESIAFCGADDEVGPGWLSAIGDALSKHDFVAGTDDNKRLNPEWVQKADAHAVGRGTYGDNAPKPGLLRLNFPPYLRYTGSGFLGIRRSVHAHIGGFDVSLRALEDVDYCLRVQLSGTELHFAPDVVVHVRLRTTIHAMFEQQRHRGKYLARIYKRYRHIGIDAPSFWALEIVQLHYLLQTCSQAFSHSASGRAAWFARLGWNIGVVQGGLRDLLSPPSIPPAPL